VAATVQAGLSALKTPLGVQDNCNVEDPLHLESFRSLAAPLPFAKHLQSKLVCHLTRELMNENNPPMVLPNGYVYSLKVLVLNHLTPTNGLAAQRLTIDAQRAPCCGGFCGHSGDGGDVSQQPRQGQVPTHGLGVSIYRSRESVYLLIKEHSVASLPASLPTLHLLRRCG
jgi:hypothetical protein